LNRELICKVVPHSRIRLAMLVDIDELTSLAKRFIADGTYWGERREFDAVSFADHVKQLIESPIVAVFVVEDTGIIQGAIAVAILPDILTGKPVAMKLHWFANGGAGLRLERAARQWAKEQGATSFKMSAINDNSAKLLERLGYTRTEVIYSKSI
jgi:hypothetical protein